MGELRLGMLLALCTQLGCRPLHQAQVKSDEIPGSYDATLELGSGYDKAKKQGALALCVSSKSGPKAAQHGEFGELQSRTDLSYDQAMGLFNGSLSGGLRIDAVTGGASVTYAVEHSADELSKTFTFFWSGSGRSQQLGSDLQVTALGTKLVQAAKVRPSCGDEFIKQIDYGASLVATLRVDFANARDKQTFQSQLSLQTQSSDGISIDLGGGFDRSALSDHVSLGVHVRQIGGKAANLANAVPDAITSCTLANFDPCLNALKAVQTYAQNTFRTDLGSTDQWVPVKYATQSYEEAGLQSLVTAGPGREDQSDLNYQVGLVSDKAVAALRNADRAGRLLINKALLHLPSDKIDALTAFFSGAKANAAKYQRAIDFCLHQAAGPSECSDYVDKVTGPSLTAVNPEVLSLAGVGNDLPEVFKTDAFGGFEGQPFDATLQLSKASKVRSISLYRREGLNWPVGIMVRTSDDRVYTYGAQDTRGAWLDLADDETITQVDISLALLGNEQVYSISYIKVTSSKGHTTAFGVPAKNQQTFTAPPGAQFTGFYGQSGAWLNRLGLIYSY